jgi:hypothetical protein
LPSALTGWPCAAENRLYYWDETALTQVTDVDLIACNDVIWIDGYFMSHRTAVTLSLPN